VKTLRQSRYTFWQKLLYTRCDRISEVEWVLLGTHCHIHSPWTPPIFTGGWKIPCTVSTIHVLTGTWYTLPMIMADEPRTHEHDSRDPRLSRYTLTETPSHLAWSDERSWMDAVTGKIRNSIKTASFWLCATSSVSLVQPQNRLGFGFKTDPALYFCKCWATYSQH